MLSVLVFSTSLIVTACETKSSQSTSHTDPTTATKMKRAFVSGEALVKFKPSVSQERIAAILNENGTELITMIQGIGVHHVRIVGKDTVETVVKNLSTFPEVEYAEPNYIHHVTAIPNDTQFTSLWGLHNTGQDVAGTVGTAGVDIDASEAWDITTGSPNVIIGGIDTGIAYDHPDLAANMWKNQGEVPNDGIDNDGNGFIDDVLGYDFRYDDSEPMDPINLTWGNAGHGTYVAGTIGSVGNNNSGVTGVMHRVKLMVLKAGDVDNGLPNDAIFQFQAIEGRSCNQCQFYPWRRLQ
jgi:subtilisin family serine protease